jgi:hypothetical protein
VRKLTDRSIHRLIGVFAILHSVAILALIALRPWPDPGRWFDPLWVGFATLWFFWPIVLVLHRGRSLLRIAIPLVLAVAAVSRWFSMYSFIGASAFGLPMGCDLHPVTMTRFFAAYVRGRADARRDIRDGQLIIEVSGFGAGATGIEKILKDRYGVETRVVADCLVDDRILGHQWGYNVVAGAEIKRRSGVDILRHDTEQPQYELFMDEHGNPK